MGITTEPGPYRRRNYWPDNDENTLFIAENELTLEDLCDRAKDYFGDSYDPEKIAISF